MSRIGTNQLHDELKKKKESYSVRVTTYTKGFTKNRFLDDCIRREFNESKMAAHVLETYYAVLELRPEISAKEPSEIKKFIIETMETNVFKVTIIATGEVIEVYRLRTGEYYDYRAMGENEIASSKTGKKRFKKEEIILT